MQFKFVAAASRQQQQCGRKCATRIGSVNWSRGIEITVQMTLKPVFSRSKNEKLMNWKKEKSRWKSTTTATATIEPNQTKPNHPIANTLTKPFEFESFNLFNCLCVLIAHALECLYILEWTSKRNRCVAATSGSSQRYKAHICIMRERADGRTSN